jgi:EAL domain-containing protein (putative c-di-GMP-specific phosphodiesterase class I)
MAMMLNFDITYTVLRQLSRRGTVIYVNYFGIGYSVFNNMKSFPVQPLKIARSFVRDLASDPRDRGIAKALLAIPHGLNLSTIAEELKPQPNCNS